MNSPEEIQFSKFIKINKTEKDAVYLQIVYQTINAIKMGRLTDGTQLPGTRLIAKDLGLHRNTVVAAIEELKSQDWVTVKPNIGAFIKNIEKKSNTVRQNTIQSKKEITTIPFIKNTILELVDNPSESIHNFTDGICDNRIINPKELIRFYTNVLKREKTKTTDILEENSLFFEQLQHYLWVTRHLSFLKKNFARGGNREILLTILSNILLRKGDCVLVAEFNFYNANMILAQSGAILKTVPTDNDGISVTFIENNFGDGEIKLLYLQSKHQYPTTQNTTKTRRNELLLLAKKLNFIIIEDDVDYELGWEKESQYTMYQENQSAWLIYLGAFGRFLNSSYQVNFLLAPEEIILEVNKYLNFMGNNDFYKEKALGEMIAEGDIHRYRRKTIKIYKERRHLFAQTLKSELNDDISIEIPTGGFAFWIMIKRKISLVKWTNICKEMGLNIPKICLYQSKQLTAIRLGFAHLTEKEMKENVHILKLALDLINAEKLN